MIQKRREQFKRDIRRKQLDSIFREKRMELLEPLNFQAYVDSLQSSQLGGFVIHSIISLERSIECQNSEEIDRIFSKLYKEIKENTFEVSAYLIIKSAQICRMLKFIIQNQQSSQGDVQRRRLSRQLQCQLILKFFHMFSLMNYRELRDDYYLKLISNIWLIFVNKEIDIFQAQNHRIFDELLKVLKKMLNSKSRIVLTNLKSMGLGAQLTNIIQFDYDYLTMDNQMSLIEIISSYLSLQSTFQEANFYLKSNGASILTMETSEKKVFMAFCLYLIDKKHEETEYFALNSLVCIFEKFEFLISSLKFSNALQISQLIKAPNRKTQHKALELTDDIIYKDSEKSSQFLQNCYLPDLLFDLLRCEAKRPSESTRSFCIIASNIICNLTLCKNRKQTLFTKHPIWDFAYQNIQMSSPLLPMVSIFQFFFMIVQRNSALKFLESYLNGVGTLEMNLLAKREFQAIKRTIQRVHTHCFDFWPESHEEKFRELIEQNHLNHLLEDLMDIEQEKGLNSL